MPLLRDRFDDNMMSCKLPRHQDSGTGKLPAFDVDLIFRQLLTKAEDVFGCPSVLTSLDELACHALIVIFALVGKANRCVNSQP